LITVAPNLRRQSKATFTRDGRGSLMLSAADYEYEFTAKEYKPVRVSVSRDHSRARRSASTRPRRGFEAVRELLLWHERDLARRHGAPPEPPPVAAGAAIRYEVMNGVPENWIPFIPVHRDGDTRSVQLQRGHAAHPDRRSRPPAQSAPAHLARVARSRDRRALLLHEEEVPRAGITATAPGSGWAYGRKPGAAKAPADWRSTASSKCAGLVEERAVPEDRSATGVIDL
jgi:hypothetical protein